MIAFAVDFSNGTIYLPGGGTAQLGEAELKRLKDGRLNRAELAARATGARVEAHRVEARRIDSIEELDELLESPAPLGR